MSDVKWIKIATGIFEHEKILMIDPMECADTIIVVWLKLLTFAGKNNNNGVLMLNERIPYTDDMLAAIFRRDPVTVKHALDIFERFGMIEIVDGIITIPNWNKYQSLDALEKKQERDRVYQAERRAKQREKIKKSSDNRLTSCDSSSDVVALEEEKEEEEEEEIRSFVPSEASEKQNNLNSYVQQKVDESGLEGSEADAYKQEVLDGLKQKYMGGPLGQGVVLISDEQFKNLCDGLSFDEIEKYFSIVVECEKSGKHYKKKSHYQAILDMANKDRQIEKDMKDTKDNS